MPSPLVSSATDARQPFWETAPTWEELAPVAEVAVAALIAVVGALWALKKWREEQRRRDEQHLEAERERQRIEREKLDQLVREEANTRTDRAAALISELGKTNDRQRWWAASALSMYPDEALPVLISALGQAEPRTATALATALLSIGAPSVQPLARANRIASRLVRAQSSGPPLSSREDPFIATASTMLDHSRTVLAHLLEHLSEEERTAIDLEDIDLQACFFRGADLSGLRLRKADISGCDFSRAKLRDANLRGTKGSGAAFTRAILDRADLTGYRGPSQFISASLRGATLRHANLVESDLSNVRLDDADLEGCSFISSCLRSADLRNTRLHRTRLNRIDGFRLALSGTTLTQVRGGRADLTQARLQGTVFEGCTFTGATLDGVKARGVTFVDCDLAGSSFRDAKLPGATIRGCNLAGTDFSGADMSGATVERCRIYGFPLGAATLTDAEFIGPHEFDAARVATPANETWRQAHYDEPSRRLVDALRAAAGRAAATNDEPPADEAGDDPSDGRSTDDA